MTIVNDDSLPSREAIEDRLEAQRKAVFQAQGVCGLAAAAARYFQNNGDDSVMSFTTHVWTALEGVEAALDRIAGALEPATLLAPSEIGKEVRS